MKINYQLELEKILKEEEKKDTPSKLLLHSCCGPCSTYVLEYLSNYFEIGLLYYNPNIFPKEEFNFREDEQRRLIEKIPSRYPIKFIQAPYEPKVYYDYIKGYEKDKEGGERCRLCFDLRLKEAARLAKKLGYDYFTTTLSISPHKKSQILNDLGEKIAKEYGLKYLFSDFKKKNGFKRSVELTEKYDMYRQDYCGCVFSYREAEDRKKAKEAEDIKIF
ncbi:MAG: epoxyqueuosine reductase QueH [Tissierellia bacterium]|nr:epoxyqueuosine reductase QueH [Tissierellia bacterium]